jgi:alkylated DNA repair dioxygenase AlkB
MTASWRVFNFEGFDYRPGFLCRAEADRLLTELWQGLDWSQKEIVLFGNRVLQPRLVAWYGERGAAYSYSGLRLDPAPWHPDLRAIRDRLEKATGTPFNGVLANAYRDGADSMGWHSDDEPELGDEPVIASLSLGAERAMRVRPVEHPPTGRRFSQRLLLEHGSLLVMHGASQSLYQHSLPKTKRPVGLRINLTYRWIRNPLP